MHSRLYRTARVLSFIVLGMVVLCIYSYAVVYASRGGQKLGVTAEFIVAFANLPKMVIDVLKSDELAGIPPAYRKGDPEFREMNNLGYDLFGLSSFWNEETGEWEIKLINFRTEQTIHQWYVNKDHAYYDVTDRQFPNSRLMHSLLDENMSVIACNSESTNMIKLDSNSNIVWSNHEKTFHHSLNFDADSNIWICTSDIPLSKRRGAIGSVLTNFNGKTILFREDYLTQIDRNTGKIIFDKGITEIFLENGFKDLAYGLSAPANSVSDIHHLNDIQPALKDSKYWKKGDVFVSLRHRSLIFQYRPSDNRITRLIQGPFLNQHDVDIISDHEISLFNNNWVTEDGMRWATEEELKQYANLPELTLENSEVIIYDFADSSFRTVMPEHFATEKIQTITEGLHEFLSNGDLFVEASNSGKIFILNKDGFVLKQVFTTPMEGYVHLANWFRIYEDINEND